MTTTTTTAAPKYLNKHGWSDVHPFEVISMSPSGKTAKVREMNATLDPEWKPEWVSGGFAGHVTNNGTQRWLYSSNPDGHIVTVRLCKRGWQSNQGRHVPSDHPVKFHDYNF